MAWGRGRLSQSLGPLRRVFANPNLRRLQLAYVGFNVTEWSTWIAILVYAYGVGGPTAVGVVALIQLAPAAIVAPFAALLGDRHRRERVLFLGYLAQAVAMGATAVALLTRAPVALVYGMAAVAASSITVTRPVQGALLPSLSRTPDELTASNAASSTVEGVCILGGPALTGLLLGVGSPGLVFAVMAAWMAGSALIARGIRVEGRAVDRADAEPPSVVGESLRGFRALAAEPHPRLLVGLGTAHTVVWGVLDVLIVMLAIELLRLGEPGVGYLNSALGAGGLIGAMATVVLVGRRKLAPSIGVGMLLWGTPLVLIGAAPSRVAAPFLLALMGSGHALMDVAGRTLLQRTVADEVLSRVLGVLEGLIMAGLGVGSIVAPLLVAGFGLRGALVAAGAFLPLFGLLLWRGLTRVDAAAVVPSRELALLRPIALFAPLPVPVIERLASSMKRLVVTAGAVVVRQGEPGDLFYVIAEGEVEVARDGRSVDTLGPGDHFGEIALLRDVPRTATVTARSHVELYALERDEFIGAVTGHPQAAEAADVVIATRLDRTRR